MWSEVGILSPLSPSALLFLLGYVIFCSGRRQLQRLPFPAWVVWGSRRCLCEPVVLGSLCVCHSIHWLVFVGVIVEWCFIMSSQDVAQKHKQQPPEALDPRWV